jgi:hypothetical protein
VIDDLFTVHLGLCSAIKTNAILLSLCYLVLFAALRQNKAENIRRQNTYSLRNDLFAYVLSAADKLALIIGVSTYRSHGEPLPAVEHDMQATVAAFQKMGFKVVSLLDLTLAEMNDAINMFCDLLSQDVYGKFLLM